MSARTSKEKEKEKLVQDRLQIFLSRLLQDEDNKYCVDCDAKGPRWASWNLGIFLCIRCAGIHRNLGVHISKVRSVNLDSWTPLQVASMQAMGNRRARLVYEANLPEDFRRPQTDSQLEQFIRSKYDRKKYVDKTWIPPKVPEFPIGWNDLVEAEKQKKDPKTVTLPLPPSQQPTVAQKSTKPADADSTSMKKNESDSQTVVQSASSSSLSEDLFGLNLSGSDSSKNLPSNDNKSSTSNFSSDLLGLGDTTGFTSTENKQDVDFFGLTTEPPPKLNNNDNKLETASSGSSFDEFFGQNGTQAASMPNSEGTKMSKDSILALFNKPGQQTQSSGNFLPQQPSMFGGQPFQNLSQNASSNNSLFSTGTHETNHNSAAISNTFGMFTTATPLQHGLVANSGIHRNDFSGTNATQKPVQQKNLAEFNFFD